jgi:TrmH family RNA methyltransferase
MPDLDRYCRGIKLTREKTSRQGTGFFASITKNANSEKEIACIMITSFSNDKVKLARALARRRIRWRERCFIMEGVRLLGEVARREICPRFVLHTETATLNMDAALLLAALNQRGVPCHLVSDEVMEVCTDTVTPPGLLAVVPFPDVLPPVHSDWTLIIDNVRTPGNLGAILRSAAAAGVDQVLLSPGTVDLFNPKVVRGGAGVHFDLPIFTLSWQEIETSVEELDVWLAAIHGDVPYTIVNWNQPLALIIGGEARGASQAALALADGRVTIPMARGVESLNAAVAAGVLLFEISRQRRASGRMLE